jgi:phosphoribosylglycinamide formyltransferase-1
MLSRLGILISGRGSNFVAIHEAIERGELPAKISIVISNRPGVPGLARAHELGLQVAAIPHHGEPDRESHEEKVLAALRGAAVEWVCLAGYMRLLSPTFVDAYRMRILNIHPSLLPSFSGTDAQAQALDHGVRVSGCTVHLVDEDMDGGPIVVQRAVRVADEETAETLAAKILEQEHVAYVDALRRLLTETWELRGRRLVFLPPS